MKKMSMTLKVLLFITALFSLNAMAGEPHQVISGDKLQSMMKDGKPIRIIDVREPELFSEGHVPGAINIPYEVSRDRVLKELAPNERIVFICHSGPMGDKLGRLLKSKGYSDVYNLDNGMRKWRGPLEKSK